MKRLFVTHLYEAELGDEQLLAELAHSIRSLAEDDQAGKRWSRGKGYKGYTSYASLNDLPRRGVRQRTGVRSRAQAEARQPVGQSAEARRPP